MISILTACHNQLRFLKDCLSSVQGQTYNDWEHIIVDDCSKDGSWEYLSQIQDERVRVFRNEDRKYCSSTYAVALSHAKGEICGILDADDMLEKQAMALVSNVYGGHPHLVYVYTQHYWCDETLRKKRKGVSSSPKNGLSLAEMTQNGRHCFSHWRTFRRELAERAVLFPEGLQVSVDKNLGFTLEELGPGAFFAKELYYYRYYKGNMSLVQGSVQKKMTRNLAKRFLKKRKKSGLRTFSIVKIG